MKNLFFLTAFLLCSLLINGQKPPIQTYLQKANACFENGDYECAKLNYNLWQGMDGSDMSAQIKKADDCLKAKATADAMYSDKNYTIAKTYYQKILDLNPKDAYARKQYSLCTTQLGAPAPNNPVSTAPPANSSFADYVESAINLQMVALQGGTFTMGCTSEQDSDCEDDEKPAHTVTVSNFYIGKYEVTQAQWRAIMGNNPSNFKGDNLPVEMVSWDDIKEFIYRLNARTGKQYRLPTEAEWEFAARGGNKSQGYKYSGSNNIENIAWYDGNSGNTTHPVGQKLSNKLGVYDMNGNVWEWCNDWCGAYTGAAQTNPQGASSGSSRVIRGGGWGSGARRVRVSYRNNGTPVNRINNIGFRLACSSK